MSRGGSSAASAMTRPPISQELEQRCLQLSLPSYFFSRGRGNGSGAVLNTPLVIPYSQDMPRPRRAAEAGLINHALNRADAQLAIFQTDEDYAALQRVLAEAAVRHHMRRWLTA